MQLMKDPYFLATIKVAIIVYAGVFAPRLPDKVVDFMKTTPMKILFATLIIFSALHDLQISLLLACAFVLSINVLSGRGILEGYADITGAFTGKKNPQGIIEPTFFIYPGCMNITFADLLAFFDGDKYKLQETVHYVFRKYNEKLDIKDSEKALIAYARYAGLPHNVEFNDKNAPLIATMLLQYGYKLSDTCLPPQ